MRQCDLSADEILAHEPPDRETLLQAMAAVLAMAGDDREVIEAIFAPVTS